MNRKTVLGLVTGLLAAGLLAGCASALTSGQPEARPLTSSSAAVVAGAAPLSSAPPAASTTPATSSVAPTSVAPSSPKPAPAPNPCAGNQHAQLVKVSVARQTLWMCAGTRAVYTTRVTTGAVSLPYDSTPTGTFQIQALDTDQTLTLNTGQQYQVKYWIPFQGPLFGFHDASWQTFPFGSASYKTEGSHGCVHMPLAAIAYLYHWARVGATVVIA